MAQATRTSPRRKTERCGRTVQRPTGAEGQGGDGQAGAGGELPTCTNLPEVIQGPEDAASYQTLRARDGGYDAFATVFRNGPVELVFQRLDDEGTKLAEHRIDTSDLELDAYSAEPTADGGWVIAGTISSSADGEDFAGLTISTQSVSGGSDAFIARLAADGNALWLRGIGSSDTYEVPDGDEPYLDGAEAGAYALAIGPDGAVAVVGQIQGSVDLGDGVAHETGEAGSRFALSLDDDGSVRWATLADDAWLASVGVDRDGRVITASEDGTHCRDASGADVWESPVSGWMSLDPEGNVYVSNAEVDGYDWDAHVTKLDRDGALVWTHDFATPAFEEGTTVAVGADLLPVVVVACEGPFDFGGGLVQTCGARDMCVVWLDEAGEIADSVVYGDADENVVASSLVADDGSVWLAGGTWHNPSNGQDNEGYVYRVTR